MSVLLLGAGRGEATCGILYLAGYLRRNGVEAYVRLYDDDATAAEIRRSLAALLGRVRPRVVGISLKWFNHLSRGCSSRAQRRGRRGTPPLPGATARGSVLNARGAGRLRGERRADRRVDRVWVGRVSLY